MFMVLPDCGLAPIITHGRARESESHRLPPLCHSGRMRLDEAVQPSAEPDASILHLSAMPRFFFHLREREELIADEIGVDFASVEEARRHAEDAARDIVAEKVKTGEVIDGEAIEVALRTGERVAEIPLRSVLRIKG